jgi:hypothetical protein
MTTGRAGLKLVWIAAVLLGGCSLALDSGVQGHSCGPDGACLGGYVCSAANICVTPDKAACNPGCSAIETCYKQQCIPVCAGRSCAAGMSCSEGVCQALAPSDPHSSAQQEGAACTSDAECTGSAPNAAALYCLVPFGGHSSGFCTASCRSNADCGPLAPVCATFRSEAGDTGLQLCAAASFTPCKVDSDCSVSGLVCGVYATGSVPGQSRAVSACRSPLPQPVGLGAKCDPSTQPCINGLCIQESSDSGDHICSASCVTNADCDAALGTKLNALCLPVTVGGRISGDVFPHVRSQMCVPRGLSLNTTCQTTSTAAQCNADAPDCILVTATSPTMARCSPHCTDALDPDAQRCLPGYQCVQANGDSHCLVSQ